METVEVESGLIQSYRYFEQTKELQINFRDGRSWVHANVPKAMYERMTTTASVVHYWATQIRQSLGEDEKKLFPVVKAS